MENKDNKSGKLSKRKMKLIKYEDKISRMNKEEFIKELQEIANENYTHNTLFNGVWSIANAISAMLLYNNDCKVFSIFASSLSICFFGNMIYYMNKDGFRDKKLEILNNYIDSEEVKENEKIVKKNYLNSLR